MATTDLPYDLYLRQTKRDPVWHARFLNEAAKRFVKTVSCHISKEAEAKRRAEEIPKQGIAAKENDPLLVPYLKDSWSSNPEYARP